MKKPSAEILRTSALRIVMIALFSALLTGGKLILSAVANVEVVSLLILVYASSFGPKYTLPATLVFCITETLIYGFGTWVLLYFIYWNLFALGASFLLRKQKLWAAILYVFLCTVFFGVLSSLIDALFTVFNPENTASFGVMFSLIYLRGVWFYVTHVVSNVILVTLLYRPLCSLCNSYLSLEKDQTFFGKRKFGSKKLTFLWRKKGKPKKPNEINL